MTPAQKNLQSLLTDSEGPILQEWVQEAVAGSSRGESGRRVAHEDAQALMQALRAALGSGADPAQFNAPAWQPLKDVLEGLSRSRASLGHTAGETSVFVLALKKPLFTAGQQKLAGAPQELVGLMWATTQLVDGMAQWTVDTYQRTREDIIKRQQEELLELSTPVIKLWEGVLAVPMIGTLDSSRTQVVMETLLQRIVDTGSNLAIIDITGVPTVDTLVAQHLLKTVSAIRLMGAECIISGIRPQIAQTIVHLGIDLQGIATRSSLADALSLALSQQGYAVTRGA